MKIASCTNTMAGGFRIDIEARVSADLQVRSPESRV
jgi:hypothetical protein